MKRSPLVVPVVVITGLSAIPALVAYADDAAPAPPAVVDAAPVATGSGSADTQPDPAPAPATPSLEEQVKALTQALADYKAATDAGAKKLLIFAIIAMISNILISILKKATGMGAAAKKWLPVVALGLGVVVGLFSNLSAGQSYASSILYGAGPPMAVFLNELLNLFRKAPPSTPAPSS